MAFGQLYVSCVGAVSTVGRGHPSLVSLVMSRSVVFALLCLFLPEAPPSKDNRRGAQDWSSL
jgi:hypothetical protein